MFPPGPNSMYSADSKSHHGTFWAANQGETCCIPKGLVHSTWFYGPLTSSVWTRPWKLTCEIQTPLSSKQAESAKNALFCELLASPGQNAISFVFSCQRHETRCKKKKPGKLFRLLTQHSPWHKKIYSLAFQ